MWTEWCAFRGWARMLWANAGGSAGDVASAKMTPTVGSSPARVPSGGGEGARCCLRTLPLGEPWLCHTPLKCSLIACENLCGTRWPLFTFTVHCCGYTSCGERWGGGMPRARVAQIGWSTSARVFPIGSNKSFLRQKALN
eukprot:364639-Chlamydomonas_euryale.AAC.7